MPILLILNYKEIEPQSISLSNNQNHNSYLYDTNCIKDKNCGKSITLSTVSFLYRLL